MPRTTSAHPSSCRTTHRGAGADSRSGADSGRRPVPVRRLPLTRGPGPAVPGWAVPTVLDRPLPRGPGCLCTCCGRTDVEEPTMIKAVRIATVGAALAGSVVLLQG